MTSNCLIEPQPAYRNRIFTLGPVGWPGVRHLDNDDLSLVVKAAQSLPGFTEDALAETVTTGFARNAVLSVADKVIEAVKAGDITRSCSSAAATLPAATTTPTPIMPRQHQSWMTFIATSIGSTATTSATSAASLRLLDVGQCNDSYSAIQIALAPADASNAASTTYR